MFYSHAIYCPSKQKILPGWPPSTFQLLYTFVPSPWFHSSLVPFRVFIKLWSFHFLSSKLGPTSSNCFCIYPSSFKFIQFFPSNLTLKSLESSQVDFRTFQMLNLVRKLANSSHCHFQSFQSCPCFPVALQFHLYYSIKLQVISLFSEFTSKSGFFFKDTHTHTHMSRSPSI